MVKRMWYAVCVFIGIFLGVVFTWAVERRRYEVMLRDLATLNAAIAEILDAIVVALTKLAQSNGGDAENE